MILFVGIVAWVFWPRNRQRLERHGRIPLEDDEPSRRDGDGAEGRRDRKDHGK
ncbi:MAG: cbb3-type cytochrome oxidase subunit 3 [Acidobacteriota bacterium]